MNRLSVFASYLGKRTFILKSIASLPWKSIIIFFFIISLTIAPSENLQLSAFSSADIPEGSILNQRQFGIPLFSPAIILLFLLFSIFIKEQLKTKTKVKLLNFEILLLLFLIIAQVSAIFSFNISASVIWFLKFLFGITIYTVFSRLQLNKKKVQIILYALFTVIFLNAIVASLQFIGGGLVGIPFENIRTILSPQYISSFRGSEYFRVTGLLSHPQNLSNYLGLILPIVLALSFLKSRKIKIAAYVAVAGCIGISFISLSRLGLIRNLFSLILVFTIMKFLRLHLRLKKSIKIYIILAIIVMAGVFTNQTVSARFLQFSSQDASLKARLELISQSLETVKQNPLLGIGPGTFPIYLMNYDYTQTQIADRFPAPVHSFYLLLASEIGIPALLITILAFTFIIKFFFEKIRFLKEENKIIAIGLFASVITFFFGGLFDPYSFGSRLGFLFLFTLGLFVNILSRQNYQ